MGRLGDGHGHLDHNEDHDNEKMELMMTMVQSEPGSGSYGSGSYDPSPNGTVMGMWKNRTQNIRASSMRSPHVHQEGTKYKYISASSYE